MNARTCPACQRELPEATLRALEQGTACPYCATRLKRTPRRASGAVPADNDQAAFQVSHTPEVIPGDEDSYRWFQTKGSPGATAPAAATVALAPARSLFQLPAAGGTRGPAPSARGTPGPVRSEPAPVRPAQAPAARNAATAASLDLPPPAPRVEPRRAPTLIGAAPPPAEKPSPPPTPAPPVHSPIVRPAQAEPPRAAVAMTAVLPIAGATLALAAPAMGFTWRSRRNMALAVGVAMATVLVAILFLRRSPADRRATIARDPAATIKLPSGSAPLAALHETSRASPAIQPPPADTETARTRERDAAGTVTAAPHAKVRIAHRATAHQRRYAKHDKHGKRARHERRNARRTEVASRATPSSPDEGEARASYERGNALLFAGDAAGAVAAYRKAVELAPADPIGYRGLGLAYEQQGGTAAAIRALRKYLKLAPAAADREIISRRLARLGGAASRE